MLRYLAGAASMLVLIAAGFFLARTMAVAEQPFASPPAAQGLVDADAGGAPVPPQASEKSKEEKRFNRYDRDKNGVVARAEYLLSRQKAYTKLDTNGDGTLSFEEFAVKTSDKFKKADGDASGGLDRKEFATTRIIRKAKATPRCDCSRAVPQPPMAPLEDDEDS